MKYKNLHNYKEFLIEKVNYNKEEILNENLLGKAFKFLTNKLGNYAKKVKASKKIDPIIEEAKTNIDNYFKDTNLIDQLKKMKSSTQTVQEAQTQEVQTQTQEPQNTEKSKEEKNKENESNPLRKAINNTLELTKKKVMPYTKDDKGKEIYTAKIYASAKFVELEEIIIQKEIELYKQEKWDTTDLEQKAKEESEKIKRIGKKLDGAVQNDGTSDKEFSVGDIVTYTNKNGKNVMLEITKTDGILKAIRISSNDDDKDADEQTPLEKDDLKKELKPNPEEINKDNEDNKDNEEKIAQKYSDITKVVSNKLNIEKK